MRKSLGLTALVLASSLALTGCGVFDDIDVTPINDSGVAPSDQIDQIDVAADVNTKTDMNSIAQAQQLNFAYSSEYFTDLAAVQEEGVVRFTLSGSADNIVVTANSTSFIITAVSSTGKVFTRTNASAETVEYADIATYNTAPSPIEGLDKPVVG